MKIKIRNSNGQEEPIPKLFVNFKTGFFHEKRTDQELFENNFLSPKLRLKKTGKDGKLSDATDVSPNKIYHEKLLTFSCALSPSLKWLSGYFNTLTSSMITPSILTFTRGIKLLFSTINFIFTVFLSSHVSHTLPNCLSEQ